MSRVLAALAISLFVPRTVHAAPLVSFFYDAGTDSCNGSPADGKVNPGDTNEFDLTYNNTGDQDAIDYTAELVPTGGTLVHTSPNVYIPVIPVGGSIKFRVAIRLDPVCPVSQPRLAVNNGHSNSGVSYGDTQFLLAASVDCAASCAHACDFNGLGAGQGLLAVKSGIHVDLSFSADAAASEHHINAVTDRSAIADPSSPPGGGSRRPPVGVGVARCTTETSSCRLVAELLDATSPVYYVLYTACGETGDLEGPF